MKNIVKDDPVLADLITNEELRMEQTINLIAAENHAPQSIMEVMGSILNTKAIEGYPGNPQSCPVDGRFIEEERIQAGNRRN